MRLKSGLSLCVQNIWLFTFQISAVCKEIYKSALSNILFVLNNYNFIKYDKQ